MTEHSDAPAHARFNLADNGATVVSRMSWALAMTPLRQGGV